MKTRLALAILPLMLAGMAQVSYASDDTVLVQDPSSGPLTFTVPQGTGQVLSQFYGPLNVPDQWILFTDGNGNDARLTVHQGYFYLEASPLGPLLFNDLPPTPDVTLPDSNLQQQVNQYFTVNDHFVFPPTFATVPVAVPEPASLSVLGLGAAALLRRRRKA